MIVHLRIAYSNIVVLGGQRRISGLFIDIFVTNHHSYYNYYYYCYDDFSLLNHYLLYYIINFFT